MQLRPFSIAITLTLALLTLAGCTANKPAGPQRAKVGFVSNNAEEFWTIAEAGTKKGAEEEGCIVLFRRPKNPTAAAQKEIIEDLLAQKVQAIAISVIDPENQREFLDEVGGRVHLLTQDNDAPQSKRKCYLGTDNYFAGRDVGKMIKETLPDGGTIAIFVGQPDPINAKERRQGVIEELAGLPPRTKLVEHPDGQTYGKYKLHATKYDNVEPNKAKDNAADVVTQLKDQPNLCLVGLWAYNPPAILSAVKEAKKEGQVKIVGFDEAENTLLGIKEGHIHGTVVQQPFEFGLQSVKTMSGLIKDPNMKLPADGIHHVPHLVVKKDNVEEFHKKLKSLLGKG